MRGGGGVNATPLSLYPRERPGTHCIGSWVVSRTGLDGYEKILHHGDSIPGGFSQSLYRLSYPELLMMHRLCLLILHQIIFNFL
jgi:hypothetical protein